MLNWVHANWTFDFTTSLVLLADIKIQKLNSNGDKNLRDLKGALSILIGHAALSDNFFRLESKPNIGNLNFLKINLLVYSKCTL